MTENKNILVIGLGSMGYGIAKSLMRSGYKVFGQDKNIDQQQKFIQDGGLEGEVLYDQLEAVIIVVLNEQQTGEIIFGEDGIANKLKNNTLIMVCTTVSPDFAREMDNKCVEKGLLYLDAPISGGSKKSLEGKLSYMISGSQKAQQKAKPLLVATAEKVFEFGTSVGITQGIEPKKFLEVISECAGTSWMLENRAPHIIDDDYSPKSSINIWPKDLGIVLDIAKKSNFSAPLTATAMQQFVAAAGSGLGHEDDAAVAKIYARNAGIKLTKN